MIYPKDAYLRFVEQNGVDIGQNFCNNNFSVMVQQVCAIFVYFGTIIFGHTVDQDCHTQKKELFRDSRRLWDRSRRGMLENLQ